MVERLPSPVTSRGRAGHHVAIPAPAAPPTPPRAWTAPAPELDPRRPITAPVPLGGDFDRPSPARVYDFLLGGAAHGAVDRDLAARLLHTEPRMRAFCATNRAFLRRAVRYLLAAGVDQFVDLGSGVPTMGHVHEVIAGAGARATVAYVDVDPVAVAHGHHLLAGVPGAAFVGADLRDPDAVLDDPALREIVDLSRPVGLLAVSSLQHVPDAEDPAGLVDRYLARLVPGSALALSHPTLDGVGPACAAAVELMRDFPQTDLRPRSAREVARLARGVDLVDPGLVRDGCWRPVPARVARVDVSAHWAGVGFRS